MSDSMKELCIKTLLPVMVTLLTTFLTTCGAYTYQLNYVKGTNEQEKGHLTMIMSKACQEKMP